MIENQKKVNSEQKTNGKSNFSVTFNLYIPLVYALSYQQWRRYLSRNIDQQKVIKFLMNLLNPKKSFSMQLKIQHSYPIGKPRDQPKILSQSLNSRTLQLLGGFARFFFAILHFQCFWRYRISYVFWWWRLTRLWFHTFFSFDTGRRSRHFTRKIAATTGSYMMRCWVSSTRTSEPGMVQLLTLQQPVSKNFRRLQQQVKILSQ